MAELAAPLQPVQVPAETVPAPGRAGAPLERAAAPTQPHAVPWPAPSGRGVTLALVVLGILAVLGIIALISLIVSGTEPRSKWGYTAAALVFILSTLQAMPIFALGSRLTTAYWAIPLRRAADLGAVSGLITAPLCIVLLFQLPDWSGRSSIWLDWPGAPRLYDGIAIVLLALLGLALVYVNGLPDIASRARRPSWWTCGWVGAGSQWGALNRALAILGALYVLLFVFVHLVVASDLAMSLVPGWKSSDLPPYQAASALEGGLASMILIGALVRRGHRAQAVIGRDTFHACGKLLLTFALFWFYFTWAEFLTDWYGREPEEIAILNLFFVGPYLVPFALAAALAFVVPLVLMVANVARASVWGPTIGAACVVVGLFADRIRWYVGAWSLAGPPGVPAISVVPPAQPPGVQDALILVGMPAAAGFVYLLSLRVVPVLSGWELAMRRLLQATRVYGKRTAPVLAKPPHDGVPGLAQRTVFPALKLDRDLLWFAERTPRWFWLPAGFLGLIIFAAAVCVALLIAFGLELTGLQNTVYWAVFITNFVFWIEISHAGVLMSAMLRLSMAQWRRPITRLAESMAIFGLMTAGIFPIIHTGRMWRTGYWIFPYDFSRTVWPNIRSPLVWDPSAIVTYLVATILFVSVGLIPDIAAIRDRASGWRRTVYGLLALGYQGTARQWRLQHAVSQLLSALVLPVFVSVTSIVAWDFSMATLPGWHSTAYAPYFVIGAVHSGIAAVVTGMTLLRRPLRLADYFTADLYDTIGRLELVILLTYLFFAITDFQFALFDRDPVEYSIWQMRLLQPPVNILFYVHLLTSIVIPFFVWISKNRRRNIGLMFFTAIVVNIGEWIEHYLDVVNPENLKQTFVFLWVPVYQPHLVEYIITFGSIATVALGVFVFAKVFPIVPLHPQKEGQVLKQQLLIGRAEVPAAVHED